MGWIRPALASLFLAAAPAAPARADLPWESAPPIKTLSDVEIRFAPSDSVRAETINALPSLSQDGIAYEFLCRAKTFWIECVPWSDTFERGSGHGGSGASMDAWNSGLEAWQARAERLVEQGPAASQSDRQLLAAWLRVQTYLLWDPALENHKKGAVMVRIRETLRESDRGSGPAWPQQLTSAGEYSWDFAPLDQLNRFYPLEALRKLVQPGVGATCLVGHGGKLTCKDAVANSTSDLSPLAQELTRISGLQVISQLRPAATLKSGGPSEGTVVTFHMRFAVPPEFTKH